MESKLFIILLGAWMLLSLFLTVELHDHVFYNLTDLQMSLLWVPLAFAPLTPIAWVWLLQKSPRNRHLFAGTAAIGIIIAVLVFNYRSTEEWFILPLCWSAIALSSAYLLRDGEHLSVFFKGIRDFQRHKVNHIEYLHQLDEQISIGLPNIMRVRGYFIERLPEIIPSLENHMPSIKLDGGESFPDVKSFMIQKLSTELTFLCAIAFLDRVCGPDFRYTAQYKAVRKFFLSLKSSEGLACVFEGVENVVSETDLANTLKALDIQMERRSDDISASNVIVSVAGLRHIILSGLVNKNQMDADAIGKAMYSGMARMRDMFKNRYTVI